MSADGRYVAFGSQASNLVPDDQNDRCGRGGGGNRRNCNDIFVHDRLTGFTRRVSVAGDGTEGNGHSTAPASSADGFTVAFDSLADNLVADDSNGVRDVFVAAPDPAYDLTGNGDASDTILQVFDTRLPNALPLAIAPARSVAVQGECAAFLLSESALDPSDRRRGPQRGWRSPGRGRPSLLCPQRRWRREPRPRRDRGGVDRGLGRGAGQRGGAGMD